MQNTVDEYMEMLADDQMKHGEAPSDEVIEEMFALAGSESKEYRTAHD